MKKLVFSLLAVGTMAATAHADQTITGRVTYQGDKSPLIGATIQPVGGGHGTATDLDGNFTITVADNVKYINVSYVGLKTQQVAVGKNVSVELADAGTQLDEVVVTAMGVKRERKALGYAAQDLNADQLNTSGTTSLASAIQGKLTGVDIRQSSGAPGASSQIVIRGARSFDGNNQPLYVVDGMSISTEGDFGDVFNSSGIMGADHPSHSLDINPDDIESINVLKGQAASALYGIRASNGVVVITTKRGSSQSSRPVITLSTSISAESASRKFSRQSVYSQGNGFVANADGTVTGYDPTASQTWGPKIADLSKDTRYGFGGTSTPAGTGEAGQYYNPKYALAGQSGWQTPQTYDNVGDYFQNAYTENTSFGISQKKDNLSYSFGLSNTHQKGLMPSTGMTRWSARGLVDLQISKEWKTGFSVNYSSTRVNAAPGGNSGIMNVVYSAPAEYNLKGTPASVPGHPQNVILFRTASFRNPYWFADNDEYLRHTNRTFGNAYLEYHPTWANGENYSLYFREQAGIDAYTSDNDDVAETYNDAYTGRRMQAGSVENYGVSDNTFNNLFTVNFNANWNDRLWDLNVLLGNEVNHKNERYWDYKGTNLNYYGFPTMSNTTSQSGEEYKGKSRTVGFFGQATVSWNSELFLTVTGRQDYVSTMPHGNRGFFYPSVSLGWVFTELPALKGNRVLNYGKLRASWAQVGQAGQYYNNYYYVPSYDGGFYTSTPAGFPMGGVSALVPYYVLYDKNLKPQNTSNVETGVDLSLFNNRLRVEYTLSYQNITDQIFNVPVSGSSGYQYLLTNAGKMTTWSHELSLNAAILQNKDYSLDFGVNFTRVWNYVNSLADGVESIMLGGFVEPQVRAEAGSTYPIIYGAAFKRDEQGRLLLANGLPQATSTSQKLGNCSPDFTVGFNLGGRYKRVSVSSTWDLSVGGKIYNGTLCTLNYFGATKASLPYHEGTIVVDGIDEATGEKNTVEVSRQNYWQAYHDVSEAGIYDRSYLKLRDLTVNYDLPRLGKFNVSVYAFARNILVWSKLPELDPESSQGSENMSGYFERFSVPSTKSIGAGLKIQF